MIRIPLQHILTPFLIAFGMNGYAQQIFQHLYGGVNQEISLAAFQSPIGGIFYLGATTSTGSGSADPVIMSNCDRVIILENGTVKASGNYTSLVQNGLLVNII